MEKLSQAEIENELKKLGIQKDSDRSSYVEEYEEYRESNSCKPVKKAKTDKTTTH